MLLEGTLARKKPNPKLTSASSVVDAPTLVGVDVSAVSRSAPPELTRGTAAKGDTRPWAALRALAQPLQVEAPPLPNAGNVPGGAAPARRWAPNAPFTVGHYRLEQELALGPYGATFSGRDLEAAPTAAAQQAARAVHVTLFHPAYFAEPRRKAQRERVERAIRYDSPYVAPTFAVGETMVSPSGLRLETAVSPSAASPEAHGTVWAATAPIAGVPLTHWRRDAGVIRPDDVYRIVGQLLDAVQAIHREGGVHGSLSPETVRVVQEHAWVTSPWWLEPADVPPGEVQPLRTAWMAPELLFGEHAESAATDVYGIGLALGYLLACGLTEPGHSLLVQGIDVPPAVDDVYVRATARQKGARYQDVASFRTALEAAAGFEWRDAQKALRRGVGTGLVGLEVLEAGPVRPRVGQHTTPPALPARGNSGLLPLKPVVLSAMPVPANAEPMVSSSGPFLQPSIVATESVLHSVAGRSALQNEVERTSEDEALPTFEADGSVVGARALLEAAGHSFGPANTSSTTARLSADGAVESDVVTSAPTMSIAGGPELAGLPRRSPDPGAPYGRRASRVPSRTLQHGAPRFGSGLASVLEVDFRKATPEGVSDSRPLPPEVQVDATDGLPAQGIPEEMLRALMEAPELSSPPPLPGQTRPRWNTSNPNWGSSLEALDADGPALRLGAPPLPFPGGADVTAAVGTSDAVAPPLPGLSAAPQDAFSDEMPADDGALNTAEPTVVEAIAPALLEVDVFAPDKRGPPPIDLFAPPPTLPLDPWSDSPLVVTRGEGSSANLHIDSLPVLDEPVPSSRREQRPTPAPSPAVAAAAAVAATLDRAISRPSTTRPTAPRVQMLTPTHVSQGDGRDEPRVLRDPSGPLSGAAATLSGMPIRGDGPMMRTDGPMVAPIVSRRSRTIWLAAGAVAVGAVVAFFALRSGGSGADSGPGGSGELASIGPGGLGAGGLEGVGGHGQPFGPAAGGLAIPALGDADATGSGGDGGAADVAEIGGNDGASAVGGLFDVSDVSDVPLDSTPDGLADMAVSALVPPIATDAATVAEAAVETGPTPDATSVAADTKVPDVSNVPDVVVAPEVIDVPDTSGPKVAEVTAPSTFTPKDPAKLRCPDGMSKLKKKVPVTLADGSKVEDWEVVCIDRFEFPGAGAVPRTGVDLAGARAACVAKNKRLCTRSEWRRACGGQYPYGKDYDPERCNTAGADGAPHALAGAGSKKGCMSPSGAFDMVGNAAEWTSDGTVNGGTSLKNGEDATCSAGSKRAGGAPHVGFRCCADAKE